LIAAIVAIARGLERALVGTARLCAWLSAASLSLIVGITVVSVLMRRLAGSPMYYTEELVGLLLSASLFLALPMVTAQASHVRVTFLASILPVRGRAALSVFAAVVMLAFCGWYLVDAIPWLEFAIRRNIRSEAASLRLGPWMAVPPLSIALCALLVLVRAIGGSNATGVDRAADAC
jgi:TRAP-type C4-dicarboxylate transport system permease small subunit